MMGIFSQTKANSPASTEEQFRDSIFQVVNSKTNDTLRSKILRGAFQQYIGQKAALEYLDSALVLSKRKRIHEGEENKEVEPPTETIMKKEFKVEGMMCNHCRMHVEKALNSMEGIHATVTLNPPVATVEFSDGEKTLEELQKVVTKEAGDYTLKA